MLKQITGIAAAATVAILLVPPAHALNCGNTGQKWDNNGICETIPMGYYPTMDISDSAKWMEDEYWDYYTCTYYPLGNNPAPTSITICPKGYFCRGGDLPGDICKCPSGTTTSGEGAIRASDCNTCLDGFVWNGSECILNCPAGQAPNSAGTACEDCAVGSWKSTTDGASCTSCGTNKTTLSTGATSADDCVCVAGYRLNGSSCTACSAGTYKSDASNATTCTSCGTGRTTSGTGKTSSSDCICAAGYTGSNCTACAQGTWKSGTGTGSCTSCGENMTTDSTGSTSKSACKCIAGYVLDNGACVKSGPELCGDGYTELHTENNLVFKVWAEQTTEHAIVLQRAGSSVQCYVNLVPGTATGAINVKIADDTYHTTD